MTDLLITLACTALALALKPWRALPLEGPPWPWLAWWLALPLFWSSDRLAGALIQPMSGVPLLVLMTGWPTAVLALLPTALLTGWLAGLDPWETLHRLVWLGLVPAGLTVALGAAVRRWMPHHLFVYILVRGFGMSLLALSLSGLAGLVVDGLPPGLEFGEVAIARWLSAWGDAFLTGMLVAIFVAFRPTWLATWSDRIYLPRQRP
jgi:uncharacterized membrane protein